MKRMRCVLACAALVLALVGCQKDTEKTPTDVSTASPSVTTTAEVTTTTTTEVTATTTAVGIVKFEHTYIERGKELYGFLDENGEPCTEALYTLCQKVAEERYLVRDDEYNDFTTDSTGRVIMPLGVVDYRGLVSSVNAWGENEDVPVRFFSDGGIYDRDGVLLSETYMALQCLENETVGALCDEGYFRLDLDGNRLERLDVVKDCEALPVGGYIKTQKQEFELTLYGVRTADGETVLPELYTEVLPLSADRIVGSDTCIVHYVGNSKTHAVIVDGKGNIICDRYNHIRFSQHEDGSYYNYGLAWQSVPGSPEGAEDYYYYIIDWNGEPLLEEPIAPDVLQTSKTGVFTLKISDTETVHYSADTGEILP